MLYVKAEVVKIICRFEDSPLTRSEHTEHRFSESLWFYSFLFVLSVLELNIKLIVNRSGNYLHINVSLTVRSYVAPVLLF